MPPRRHDWWLVAAWFLALTLVRAGTIEERDPYWQVRAGMENLEGQPLVRPDSWSWDPVDALFVQTSPGWNDVLGLAWRSAGWAGLFVVSAASIGLYFVIATLLARRLDARPLPTLVGILVCVSLALSMVSPRATLAAQTLFMAGLLLVDVWRHRLPRLLAVAVAAVATASAVFTWSGSWIHLSWLALAPATVVCWGVLWFTTPEVGRARAAALSVAGVVGACVGVLLGPYGADAWGYTTRVQGTTQGLIVEWLGVLTPGLALRWLPAALFGAAVAGGGLVWAVRRWRSGSADHRIGLVVALCSVALPAAVASLSAIRFVGIALLAVAPVAGAAATALWDRVRTRAAESPPRGIFRSDRVRFWSEGTRWHNVLTMVLIVLSPGALLLAFPLSRPLPELAVVDQLPAGCRLFSDPSSAGPVLLLRPDVRVWIDTRFDYWGPARTAAAIRALSATDLDRMPFTGASCVMLTSGQLLEVGTLAAALDDSSEWQPLTQQGPARVWVRG